MIHKKRLHNRYMLKIDHTNSLQTENYITKSLRYLINEHLKCILELFLCTVYQICYMQSHAFHAYKLKTLKYPFV